jgi:NADH-quinone oxidoreductase subunit M
VTFDHHVLLWLLGLPLLAAIVVGALGPQRGPLIRWISLGASLIALVLALILGSRFIALERTGKHEGEATAASKFPTFTPEFVPGSTPGDRHHTSWDLIRFGTAGKPGTVQFFLGVDGLNIWMVILTAVLMLPSVLISWKQVNERLNEFYAWLLALQTCMMGVFLSMDILVFYVFFELSLVPLFFLIGIWGGPERQYAARKFFIYTLGGSLLTLLGVLGVVLACYQRTNEMTFSIPRLVEVVHEQLALGDSQSQAYWLRVQMVVFFLLTIGFAIKVPLVPFHTWLPLAHVEAPTAGSVDLAGVLLKIGAYGFLRLCIPLAPDVSLSYGLPLVTVLAAIGIVYGSFCAYAQDDFKRLIAYSSVAHLGLCMLGMFSLNAAGLTGSIMQMINHGLSTGALFLLIGMIYERYHTRRLEDYSGMGRRMPLFGVFLVFMCLSSVGLPGLNGFVGEVLCLVGIAEHEGRFGSSYLLTIAGVSGLVLGAWYLFTLMRHLLFGPVKEPPVHGPEIKDLEPREWLLLAPIAALCVLIGVFPQPIVKSTQPDVDTVVHIADLARERSTGHAAADPADAPVARR